MQDRQNAMELQLRGYRLTTAEIIYRLPDHPAVLQTFVWQRYDIAPRYPELHKFLDYWSREIEGRLHRVYVASKEILGPDRLGHVDGTFNVH